MAKVFAVAKEQGVLTLFEWSSKAAFSKTESFIDSKWIYIATTTDYKKEGLFNEPEESTESKRSIVPHKCFPSFFVKRTEDEIEAHNMLYRAFKRHFKKDSSDDLPS
ncbi:hypothetical protein PVK62_08310 [Aliivibrio sp. S3MY1]|uniref:Uncharacterized protein n=1 Tax=Aliivibrio finisterrensis TaxID=511998 RepID=A0ABY0I4R7_9GAMM|nr:MULTISPECIES: hypothetical protein [Aliivibrio]MDD9195842.1 hypothetical protein [Aliivibrio sp. S3MY1]RYU63779.1 hypothetical protein ERW53_12105 [Aliivibrio finisterrensis]RYU82715.1 hypothetical protein ERW52_13930 [Aliivibrio finisterrensis]